MVKQSWWRRCPLELVVLVALVGVAGCTAPPLTQTERDHYVSPTPRPYCLDDSAAPCLSQGLW